MLSRHTARPLKKFYTFFFVDCIYVNIRHDYETVNCPVYVVIAYDLSEKKDILGLWIDEKESTNQWLKIFDELKTRGVEDVLFISMDGLSGLEEGARTIFPDAIIQRCIVHLIRNSVKYIPSKKRKDFCNHLRLIYKAPNKKAALIELEKFKEAWGKDYPGAVAVWIRNWKHVEQLYDYTTPIRKVMYTTNAMEIFDNYKEISRNAANMICENDIVYLTGGSFGYIMLSFLPKDIHYTLVVNSVDIAKGLRDFNNIDVYLASGKMRQSGALVDSLATNFVSNLHFDLCFITGAGVTADYGFSNSTDETATFQKAIINNSRKKYLLMPSTKVGVDSFVKVCEVDKFDSIITDWDCIEDQVVAIEEKGVQVIVVAEP